MQTQPLSESRWIQNTIAPCDSCTVEQQAPPSQEVTDELWDQAPLAEDFRKLLHLKFDWT